MPRAVKRVQRRHKAGGKPTGEGVTGKTGRQRWLATKSSDTAAMRVCPNPRSGPQRHPVGWVFNGKMSKNAIICFTQATEAAKAREQEVMEG